MNVFRGLVGSKKKPEEERPPSPTPPQNHQEDSSVEDIAQEDRKRLWTKVSGLIGKDITSLLSLPVSLFEPMSVLQSMCEPLRYASVLDKICEAEDSIDRMCLVAAFVLALLGSYNRTVKPFNPVLGETFEFVPKDKRFKCFCEQVSHHPPIGIARTTSDAYTLQQESRIETTFWGNTVEVFSLGSNQLKLTNLDETYTWANPATTIHNLVFGRLWIELRGSFSIKNPSTGDTCTLHYKKAGWFEGVNYEISGEVRDKSGTIRAHISGKYNEQIYATKVDANGTKAEQISLWKKPEEEITNKWKWPAFSCDLTDTDTEYDAILPPSDSRLRADIRALKAGNVKVAGKEKNRIEEDQRQKRRERDAQHEKWTPVYFRKIAGTENEKDTQWEYYGNYWEEKEKRVAQYKEKQSQRQHEKVKGIATPPSATSVVDVSVEQDFPRSP